MDILSNGLITLYNGVNDLLNFALHPMSIAVVLIAVGLWWLSLIELDELNRQGTKPEIGHGR